MKILLKPKKTNLKEYINAGYSAFLFGLKNFSSYTTKDITATTIKHMLKKYKNIKIFISIDKNIFEEELKELKKQLKLLNKLDIKGIFFYDNAVLNIVKEEQLNLSLIAAQNFLITNTETCNYYKRIGCEGCLITTEITKEEIKEITEKSKTDIYVNIYGYQLMAFSKRKLVTDYFNHIKKINNKKEHYMIEKEKKYFIKENKTGTIMLSDYILDGIEYLSYYKKSKYIILNELNIEHKDFMKVLSNYKKALESHEKVEKYPNSEIGFLNTKTVYKVK